MKAAFYALVLSVAASLVSADCWSDLKLCRSESRVLQDSLDQCQQDKDSSSRAAYCWKCVYDEENRCLDTVGKVEDIKLCTQFAERVRNKCEGDAGYICRGPLYKLFNIQ
ncbi:MAG: hypothetical protein BYD32DRAFT_417487 [Podila humilis]|nr:MAG: hypothetical protein BYD32DRAFT_417487 [Podila humilis]